MSAPHSRARAARSTDRGALYALVGVVGATAVSFFVWLPQMPVSIVLGWVAGAGLVWLYARGAGAPQGRGARAALVTGAFAGALVIALGGEFGYLLRAVASELDLALIGLVLDVGLWSDVLIPTLLWPESWLYAHVGGILFAVAAAIGLFQAFAYTKRRDVADRSDAAATALVAAQTARVRALVDAIVLQLDPAEREPLLAQAATIRSVSVHGPMHDFAVDPGSPPSRGSQSPLAVSAEIVDPDDRDVTVGVILVWLREPGYLARLEYVSSTGRALETLPPPSGVRMRHADSW